MDTQNPDNAQHFVAPKVEPNGVAVDRAGLHALLKTWLRELEAEAPDLRQGERHTFELLGGRCGHDDQDHPIVDFEFRSQRQHDLAHRRSAPLRPRVSMRAAEGLHAELDFYVDELLRVLPNYDDGAMHAFCLEGGVVDEHAGELLTDFSISVAKRRINF